jgi:transposase-like protein
MMTAEGATVEWHSQLVPRYQRRSERVDEAILGVYLSGTNTRRIKAALGPLLRGGPLSKDAVSRLVGRLAEDFETWRRRDLAEDGVQYLVMDGWYPKVRIGKRRMRVPGLVTLGVRADGQRVVLDIRLAGNESTAAWWDVIRRLVDRHVGVPILAMIDGSAGLAAALREQWSTLAIQRCTTHKLRNVESKAPVRLREEMAEDYRRMVYAESRTLIEQARLRFEKKWRLRCPAVIECVDEAGDDLFTFLRFPRLQRKALERRTPWSASTRNSGVGRRHKGVFPGKMRSCCSSSGCFVADRSHCERLMGGTTCHALQKQRNSLSNTSEKPLTAERPRRRVRRERLAWMRSVAL